MCIAHLNADRDEGGCHNIGIKQAQTYDIPFYFLSKVHTTIKFKIILDTLK